MAAPTKTKLKIFDSPKLDSRIHSANTQNSERWLGYFVGPMFLYMMYYSIAGTYLTQFYTDVLGLAGSFMTLMPVISKIIDAVTNVIMGRIIDKTRTRQGKARPWILISGVLIAVTGVLLYAVPRAGFSVQVAWVIVSYNLFFAFAFTIYNMSHTLMVPLSTRNTKQRDTLALLTSTGTSMIPGLLATMIMPAIINAIGVGAASQSRWITVMGLLSILAIPATLIEYYFTKERVTEEAIEAGDTADQSVSFGKQLKACLSNKYWIIVMGFAVCYQVFNFLSTNSMIYYSNWVVGNSVESGVGNQVLINMIGQAPLGIGLVILWPLVRKFGKRYVMMFGYGIGAIGSAIVLAVSYMGMGSHTVSLGAVLGGLVVKSIGALPSYVMAAQLAEALDHIEWENGYRADGISASINTIIITVAAGIGQSIILGGISLFGYQVPSSNVETIIQPMGMQSFFTWCFVGIPMVGYIIGSLLMIPFDIEEKMPKISTEIAARHKAEAEARGETYLTPEEKAALEQAENDRVAEEKWIEELKAKCAKKGLNFDEEEAKYQKNWQKPRQRRRPRLRKRIRRNKTDRGCLKTFFLSF